MQLNQYLTDTFLFNDKANKMLLENNQYKTKIRNKFKILTKTKNLKNKKQPQNSK